MNKTIQQLALGSIFALACTLNMNAQVVSQKVGTNPTIITPSTAFEVESANKGVLLPRVALTGATDATTILAPTTSMLVYNTATAGTSPNNVTPGYYYWTGTAWTRLTNGTPSADKTDDEWVNNPASTRVELGKKADGTTARDAGTEFVVKDDGNVGIGTTLPTSALEIKKSTPIIALKSTDIAGSLNGNHIIGYAMENGGHPSLDTRLLTIQGRDIDNSPFSSSIIFRADENYTSTSKGGRIDFYTTTNGTTSAPLVMTIKNSGNVGIGTATPSTKLHIDNGTTAGAIRIVDGTQGAGKVLTSDANGVGTWKVSNVGGEIKARVTIQGNGTILGSDNVASVTRISAGRYRIFFTSSMSSLGYSAIGQATSTAAGGDTYCLEASTFASVGHLSRTVDHIDFYVATFAGSIASDPTYLNVVIFE